MVRPAPSAERDGLGVRFQVAASVTRAVARPFARKAGDPLYRPLKVYASDPAASRMEAAVTLINVPYEPLAPGPEGSLFKVDSQDPQQNGNGTGICPPGELPADLTELLAHAASSLAGHFQTLMIRAVDYCPPVDITLGEFLRALVTADYDLVPDDPWGYREALIDAFSRRAIYPRHVPTLAEDALLWRAPRRVMPPVIALDAAHLVFDCDMACGAAPAELTRQARALGEFATRPEHLQEFGLLSGSEAEALGGRAELPVVASVRIARRAGPYGQIVNDLVAEITQQVMMQPGAGKADYALVGGTTVILGPNGEIRYLISKSAVGSERIQRRRAFLDSLQGRQFWQLRGTAYQEKRPLYEALHAGA